MNDRDRLGQLRALLVRLESMPASAGRDRILGDVRARAVDVETGVKPAAMRALSPDGAQPEIPTAPQALRIEAAETAPRPKPRPRPRRRPASRRPAAHAAWSAPHARLATPTSRSSLTGARQTAEHKSVVDLLEQGEVLCLDDQPAVADGASRPWSGGLRG